MKNTATALFIALGLFTAAASQAATPLMPSAAQTMSVSAKAKVKPAKHAKKATKAKKVKKVKDAAAM